MAAAEGSALPLPKFDSAPRVLIVAAPFYRGIADLLIAGARATLEQAGATAALEEVPGALEIAPAIRFAERRYDGFVALGCVIRGETSHYDLVCNESARGLTELGVGRGLCVGNGVLTVENRAQAEARADRAQMDKGGGAAAACLHLIALRRKLSEHREEPGDPGAVLIAGDPTLPPMA